MRIIAIVANLIQLVIVLAIFLSSGPSMEPLAIAGLFLLMILAFVNLLVFLFHHPFAREDQEASSSTGPIKRRDIRVSYILGPRPYLETGKQSFEVQDLSEQGVRFLVSPGSKVKRRIKGHIKLVCGQTIDIKGMVIRRQGDEIAIILRTPIPYPVVLAEKKAITRQ